MQIRVVKAFQQGLDRREPSLTGPSAARLREISRQLRLQVESENKSKNERGEYGRRRREWVTVVNNGWRRYGRLSSFNGITVSPVKSINILFRTQSL